MDAKERACLWAQFAAAGISGYLAMCSDPVVDGEPEPYYVAQGAAAYADAMLEEYDARFASRADGPAGQGASAGFGEGRFGSGDGDTP